MLILHQFLKVTFTKWGTVEQKQQQFLKTHVNNSKNRARAHKKQSKTIKTMQITAKTVRKASRKARILSPGRPSVRNITRHAPTQLRLARTHGTHDTHETKTKTKRSRSPGYGGRINRSNSPKPPIYQFTWLVFGELSQRLAVPLSRLGGPIVLAR